MGHPYDCLWHTHRPPFLLRLPPPRGRAVALLTQGSETGTVGVSVGTTYQGKGSQCRQVRIGKTGRSRALGGERAMGSTTEGGKGVKGKWQEANSFR